MRSRFKSRGFTLIELMIVVAIVAILAAIAYPSYQDSVRKSRRADARAVLLEAAQFMERRYTENFQAGYTSVNNAALTAAGLGSSPKDGGTAYYNIQVVTVANPPSFTLSAQPVGAQSGDTGCGTLSLTNTGLKTVSGPKPAAECWR